MYESEVRDTQDMIWRAREQRLAYVMPSISLPRMWTETAATLPNSNLLSSTNAPQNTPNPAQQFHIYEKHVDHKLVRNLPCLYQGVVANRLGQV